MIHCKSRLKNWSSSPSWHTASDSISPFLGLIIRICLSLHVVKSFDPSQLKHALYTMSGWQSISTSASPVPILKNEELDPFNQLYRVHFGAIFLYGLLCLRFDILRLSLICFSTYKSKSPRCLNENYCCYFRGIAGSEYMRYI